MRERTFGGRVFKKSSFSHLPNPYPHCVYVSIEDGGVLVANLDASEKIVVEFTREEWDAFISGVKAGEFDI